MADIVYPLLIDRMTNKSDNIYTVPIRQIDG